MSREKMIEGNIVAPTLNEVNIIEHALIEIEDIVGDIYEAQDVGAYDEEKVRDELERIRSLCAGIATLCGMEKYLETTGHDCDMMPLKELLKAMNNVPWWERGKYVEVGNNG